MKREKGGVSRRGGACGGTVKIYITAADIVDKEHVLVIMLLMALT